MIKYLKNWIKLRKEREAIKERDRLAVEAKQHSCHHMFETFKSERIIRSGDAWMLRVTITKYCSKCNFMESTSNDILV